MANKKLDPAIRLWYNFFLRNRTINVSFKGAMLKRSLMKGTPQGGILSPLMWNIVFDSFLELFNEGPVRVCGFADDAGLIVTGEHPGQLMVYMQKAVNKALQWGVENGLDFNAEKTVSVLFTHKRKYPKPQPLYINNNLIPYSDQVKYLGLILDSKLSWNAHINQKIRVAKALILRIHNALGRLWGPSPKLLKWAFTGIVQPALTYGSLVWAKAAQTVSFKKKLKRVNRLALMSMGHFRKSTPTAGMEIVNFLRPLHLHIAREATLAYVRTSGLTLTTNNNTHKSFASDILNVSFLTESRIDNIIRSPNWSRNYQVVTESFASGNPETVGEIIAFTDGSLINENSGSGFVTIGKFDLENSYYLGHQCSVFQAEMYAIYKLIETLIHKHLSNHRIIINVDSQAALKALDSHTINKQSVLSTVKLLNLLGTNNEISLRWVKSHVGFLGNETADQLAKRGATDPLFLMTDRPALSKKIITKAINEVIDSKWNAEWSLDPHCRQTKLWFPTCNELKSRQIVSLNRLEHSNVIQMLTGHNYLNRHSSLVDPSTSPLCHFCQSGDVQTSFHIIAECPSFLMIRRDHFGFHDLLLPLTWTTGQLTGFLREAHIGLLSRSDS